MMNHIRHRFNKIFNGDTTVEISSSQESSDSSECQIIPVEAKEILVIELLDDSEKTITLSGSSQEEKNCADEKIGETMPPTSLVAVSEPTSSSAAAKSLLKEIISYAKNDVSNDAEENHCEDEKIDIIGESMAPTVHVAVSEPTSSVALLEEIISYAEDDVSSDVSYIEEHLEEEEDEADDSTSAFVDGLVKQPDKAFVKTKESDKAIVETKKPEKEWLQKLNTISCHRTHVTRVDQRRLLCIDCNTRICPVCYCNFKQNLKMHMGERALEAQLCLECGICFPSTCALKAHENLHRVEAPFVCPVCGILYQQLKYFIAHCLESCFHFFFMTEFRCEKCLKTYSSLDFFRKHQRSHMAFHFRCRACYRNFGISRRMAVRHIRAEHDHMTNVNPLEINFWCGYCSKVVLRNHWKDHKPTPSVTVIYCPCKTRLTTTAVVRTHRQECDIMDELPPYWARIFSKTKMPAALLTAAPLSEPVIIKDELVKKENVATPTTEFVEHTIRRCQKCAIQFFARANKDSSTICKACVDDIRGEVHQTRFCLTCKQEFKAPRRGVQCPRCETRMVLSKWVASEQVIAEEVDDLHRDLHPPCNLQYPGQPWEHNYCLRHEFTSLIREEVRSQRETFGKPFVKGLQETAWIGDISEKEEDESVPAVQMQRTNATKCFICGFKLPKPATLYCLLAHVRSYHQNAVLPVRIPGGIFEGSDDEDTDLWTRLKELQSSQPAKKSSGDKLVREADAGESQTEEIVVQKKRRRLYIPKDSTDCRKKYLVENNQKPTKEIKNETKKSSDGSRRANENEQKSDENTPQQKDYEFWDGYYEALSAVEGRNHQKGNKERVIEKIIAISSKRQVKKPKRFVEQEEPIQSGSRAKNDSESTEKKITPKRKESEKKQDPEEETGRNPSKKHRKRQVIDKDVEEVRSEMKADNEFSFVAKSFFSSGGNVLPNKRKRKLASKLMYLNRINEVDLPQQAAPHLELEVGDTAEDSLTCMICKTDFQNPAEFRQHVTTHRSDENTFQCMECGECFVVRSTLEKHLHAFHKIKETSRYIAENGCNLSVENKTQAEGEWEEEEELKDNQCKVCREMFPCSLELNKHFRIHGMAFLKEALKDTKAH